MKDPCYPVSFHEPDFCDVNLVVWDRHSVTDAQYGQQVQVSVILPKRLKIIILDNNKKKKMKWNCAIILQVNHPQTKNY